MLAGAPVPPRTFEALFHVGTLRPEDKGCDGPSWEGHGLSVSVHPAAWTRIARLGGRPTWKLVNDQARFVDVHALTDD